MTAIFYITSPFQMLCSLGAQNHYHFDDSLYILIRSDIRIAQMVSVADRFSLKYKVMDEKDIYSFSWKELAIRSLFHKGGYGYIFIGDFRASYLSLFSLQHAGFFSKLIYLDDGNISISLFRGHFIWPGEDIKIRVVNKLVSLLRRIKVEYFTVYSGINNAQLSIIDNKMSLFESQVAQEKHSIYFIGTASQALCDYYSIGINEYLTILKNSLSSFKRRYERCEAYYIPHGRETLSNSIISICDLTNFEYLQVETCVELNFIEKKIYPMAIAGFGSSALFNLKKMFPSAHAINYVLPYDAFVKEFEFINQYYSENGIENVR